MDLYGLKHIESGNMLCYTIESNGDAEFCGDFSYTLDEDEHSNKIWLVGSPQHAEFVKNVSTEWYNAGYNTPSHRYSPNELVVVHVCADEELMEVSMPSNTDVLQWQDSKYSDSDEYMAFFNKLSKEEQMKILYTLYDMESYLRENE